MIRRGEAALLRRMLAADAAVERLHPIATVVDSLRRKRLLSRVEADHPVPIYAMTPLGRIAAARVDRRSAQLAVIHAERAAAIAEQQAKEARDA